MGTNWHATWWAWEIFNKELYIGGFAPALSTEGIIEKYDNTSWTHMEPELCGEIFSLAEHNGYIYGGAAGGDLIRSSDGSTWSLLDTAPDGGTIKDIHHFSGDGNLYVATTSHLYRLDPTGPTWTDVTPTSFYRTIGLTQATGRISSNILIAMGRIQNTWKTGIAYSTDGSTWSTIRVGKGGVTRRWGIGDCWPWTPREGAGGPQNYIYFTTGRRRGNGANTYQGSGELWATDLNEQKCIMQVPYGISSICNYGGKLLVGTSWHPTGNFDEKEQKLDRWATVIDQTPDLTEASYIPVQYILWDEASISAGDETDLVPLAGYDKKTLHLQSNSAGTFSIKIDPTGSGTYFTYDTVEIPSGGGYKPYVLYGGSGRLKLSFSATATVTAKISLEAK